ncbi:MAG: outer membrane beta-barrel protein [Candidatus Eisenbacteria bacterium]|uniref:Outer membrane beta-barrel protein n=1 Tax=Eiseniibacteriota bacterium TaxID=2212470 RepID=A0A956M0V8_UNCEI|nr:outer membrane beta-barrel protein [Candidatus Eisenbacteria bacterium]
MRESARARGSARLSRFGSIPGRSWVVMSALLALVPLGAARATGLQLGARIGYTDLSGSPFQGADSFQGTEIVGLQIVLPLTRRLAVSVEGEGSSETIDFSTPGESAGSIEDGTVDWSDLALYASARLGLLPPSGPLEVYVGGGAGVHFAELTYKDVSEAVSNALEEKHGTEDSGLEWHGLAGASVGLGQLLSVFAETRYRDVTGEFDRRGWAGYVGLNLRLD